MPDHRNPATPSSTPACSSSYGSVVPCPRNVPRNGPFNSRDDAARSALNLANPRSIRENREFGGVIYQTQDGKYYYTGPVTGTGNAFNPDDAPDPVGTTRIGDYHTHGDYTTFDPRSGLQVHTDSAHDTQESDHFSREDITTIRRDSADSRGQRNPAYRGYLGTPSGRFFVYDPVADSINEFH